EPALRVRLLRLLDHRQAADARADADADALLVAAIIVETGIGDRFHRRDQAEMIERVVAARLLRRQPLRHVEVLHLARDLRWERRRVEARDPRDARAAGENAVPRRGDADADGRHDTESGDDDAARHQG